MCQTCRDSCRGQRSAADILISGHGEDNEPLSFTMPQTRMYELELKVSRDSHDSIENFSRLWTDRETISHASRENKFNELTSFKVCVQKCRIAEEGKFLLRLSNQ